MRVKKLRKLRFHDKAGDCGSSHDAGGERQDRSCPAGADVLGAVVEAVTGVTFGEFLREEFFGPLEMPDTDFYVPQEKQDRLIVPYMWDAEKKLIPYKGCNLAIMNDMAVPNAFESGGAGLASTIDDYAHFAGMLMAKGVYKGKRLMGERTVEFLTTGALTPGNGFLAGAGGTYLWKSYACAYRAGQSHGDGKFWGIRPGRLGRMLFRQLSEGRADDPADARRTRIPPAPGGFLAFGEL